MKKNRSAWAVLVRETRLRAGVAYPFPELDCILRAYDGRVAADAVTSRYVIAAVQDTGKKEIARFL